MAPQVSRLILVFTVLIAGFFVMRSQTVPADFGNDGWHRVQGPALVASAEVKHAGQEACMECHEDKYKNSPHVKFGVACETCHGPAAQHIATAKKAQDGSEQSLAEFEKAKPVKPSGRAFCGRCHGKLVARRASFPQQDLKTHNPTEPCITCHGDMIHPKEAQP